MAKIIKTLMSFNGAQDPYSVRNGEQSDGPVLNFLRNMSDFDRFILFYNKHMEKPALKTISIIQTRHRNIEAMGAELDIPDPSHYETILKTLRKAFAEKCPRHDDTSVFEYYISISSGTPQMHACWLLLAASGEIDARIFHIREKINAKKGQPLITEINPRTRYFPAIRKRIAMAEMPVIDREKINNAVAGLGIAGKDPELLKALEDAASAAQYDVPVLITGESGTGKELVAQLIRNISGRPRERFYALNCTAMPANLLESELFGYKKGAFTGAEKDTLGIFNYADGGTLFLDEIGDMALDMQAKMLRVLQDKTFKPVGQAKSRKVDVRIIAATNKDLNEAISIGLFREDLYYRLNVIDIHLPPLRKRKTDIPEIAAGIMDSLNADFGTSKQLTAGAINSLSEYGWPGNIRELGNVLKKAIVMSKGDIIHRSDLPVAVNMVGQVEAGMLLPKLGEGFNIKDFTKQIKAGLYEKALAQTGGHQSKAAGLLGVTAESVSRHVKKMK